MPPGLVIAETIESTAHVMDQHGMVEVEAEP